MEEEGIFMATRESRMITNKFANSFYHCRYLHFVEKRNGDQRIVFPVDGESAARLIRTDRTRGYK